MPAGADGSRPPGGARARRRGSAVESRRGARACRARRSRRRRRRRGRCRRPWSTVTRAGPTGAATVTGVPVRSSKPPVSAAARAGSASAARTPESGSKRTGPAGRDAGEAPRGLGGREPLGGRTRGRQRGGDGVQRGLVAERHLAGDVQQLPPVARLEVAPEVAGAERHLDVVRLGVAEAEDAGVALGARALVAGCAGRLEDDHVASPAGPGPTRRAEPEQPGADHDAAAVVGHGADHRNGRSTSVLGPGAKGPAVRSAAVTSGMDVSTHPRSARRHPPEDDRATADPDDAADPAEEPVDGRGRDPAGTPHRAGRCAPSASTSWPSPASAVPAVVLWWHVWSGHPSSTLTCACGDPAQEVWFMAWPAWAIAHLHNLFFSGRGQRPPRRQPALEHVGDAGRRRAGARSPGSSVRSPRPTSRSPSPRRSARGPASPPSGPSSPGSRAPSRRRWSTATRRPSSRRSPSATCR